AINCVVVRHIQSASCLIKHLPLTPKVIPKGRDAAPAPDRRFDGAQKDGSRTVSGARRIG
ncbi:MAG: hypothetical protein ABR972_14805, partial [Acidimicrobiales bacterium]